MLRKVTVVFLFCFSVKGERNFGNKSSIGYDAEELLSKIFSGNATQPRRVVKYEAQFDSNYVSFDDQTVADGTPVQFEGDQQTNKQFIDSNENRPTNVKFNEFGQVIAENELNPLGNRFQSNNGKKKRRRRKPKQQFQGQPGFFNPGYPGPNEPVPASGQSFGPGPLPGQVYGLARPGHNFGIAPVPGQNFGPGPGSGQNFGPNRFQPEFNGQVYRPPRRRPQPSLASDTLGAITGALTSIAHNDDYQCVARLLCEAAAGGALGGSSLLDSVSGLQPLLTLLSAYNGISSNPLFVFGRAAFLGMSSKGNTGSCRYAYPQCPTDPEQLVHYLNNHNGGFFRFFNAPQNGQQNLEQFYNQLSQNYGLYQPTSGNNQEFYGLLNQGPYQNPVQPNLYPNNGYVQNYGSAYPHNQNYNNGNRIRFKNHNEYNDDDKVKNNNNENKIEKRIQNKQTSFLNDNSVTTNSKWLFPGEDDNDMDESEVGVQYINEDDFGFNDNRKGKKLKFPDHGHSSYDNDGSQEYNKNPINFYTTETIRTPKGIFFPESQKNNDYSYNRNKYYNPVYSNGFKYNYYNENKGTIDPYKGVNIHNNYNNYQDEAGVTTVYVVRGNGDPNKPEIVKLRPGETL